MTYANPEPMTEADTALVLVDHQVGLMTGIRDYSIAELKHNVVGLAKAARALGLPIVATTTSAETLWGPAFPELVAALPGHDFIDRTTVNAWDDPRVAAAIEATERRNLIFAGVSLEVCAAFPAMTAQRKGYNAYVAMDASGTFSQTKRETGLLRLSQAGVSSPTERASWSRSSPTTPATSPARSMAPSTWTGRCLSGRSARAPGSPTGRRDRRRDRR
jgi:nicotinamidase-related amidase